MDRTESLIVELSTRLPPVERLRPPFVRAALWLLGVFALSAVLVARYAEIEVFMTRAGDPWVAVEFVGTLLTGLLAVAAAFQLSLPDRPRSWALLPLPALALWIGSSARSCWRHWVTYGPDGWVVGESADCFLWILTFGIPLGIALMLALRSARPIAPVLPAALGGLGVAALAAFLLQFFHPFDVTFMDLGLHLAATAIIAALAARSSDIAFADRPASS